MNERWGQVISRGHGRKRPVIPRAVCALSAGVWGYLLAGHGTFWSTRVRLPSAANPQRWPSVVAIVPARDEAEMLPVTLPSLLAQRYPGSFTVLVVDDDSRDDTATLAAAAGATVVRGTGPPPGWAGKVAAMAAGTAAAPPAEFLLFTDADIQWAPDALADLVRAACANQLALTSQMVLLRAESPAERWLIPAFVYFFAQLYPFSKVNRPGAGTAAAAGGCMLVRRDALEAAGGVARIADALIDDVALGRLLKAAGGRIWLGLTCDLHSVRPYPRLADVWRMVSRSAYTQLRYSPPLLAGTVAGLALVYLVPPAGIVVGALRRDRATVALGAVGWVAMSASFAPMLRWYGLSRWHAPALPAVAALYLAMTLDSARRHRRGVGAVWKGRRGGTGTPSRVETSEHPEHRQQ
jgi:hopene-associated glycosyltransferase HpnB